MRTSFLSLRALIGSPSRRLAFAAVGLLAGAGLPRPGLAQEAKSRPVGFLMQTIPAGQTRSFSVPFDAGISTQNNALGRLTAVGPATVDCAGAQWVPGAFSLPAAPYFVRLTSGVQAGRVFAITSTSNTATRLFLDTEGVDLTTLGLEVGVAGAVFEIIPGDTLATFFGAGAAGQEPVVQGAVAPAAADLVQVWNGSVWQRYYFNTVWRRWALDTDTLTDAARDTVVLRPDRGLMITRRADTPLDLAVVGRVLAVPQRAMHLRTENGRTFLATMQTGDVTLGTLAMQRADRTPGWRASADPAQADLLAVWSGAVWFTFYYNDQLGHWQRVGEPAGNRDDFLIAAGTPVWIQRRAAAIGVAERTVVFPPAGG
jgi:hypothetical protein